MTRTISCCAASQAMSEPSPASGPSAPKSISFQVTPFQDHVSLTATPFSVRPPKMSTVLVVGSYADEAPKRPDGLTCGWASVHEVPFQSQVLLPLSSPPKRTTSWVARSSATANDVPTSGSAGIALGVVRSGMSAAGGAAAPGAG